MMKKVFFGLIGTIAMNMSYAVTLTRNEDGNTIGQNKIVTVQKGDSLSRVARRYGVSLREMQAMNPSLAKGKPLRVKTQVTIPIQYVLPYGPRTGIVLNLAALRMYYFHPDGTTVSTYPVAAGKRGWSTPQGDTMIVGKEKNPAWRPPKSIIRESARSGRNLPRIIPPGPHNPLGRYAMRLGIGGILIHGTTKPSSIGTYSSHGCIRMHAKDIEELFHLVPVGTEVHIVSQTKAQIAAKQAEALANQEFANKEQESTIANTIHLSDTNTTGVNTANPNKAQAAQSTYEQPAHASSVNAPSTPDSLK